MSTIVIGPLAQLVRAPCLYPWYTPMEELDPCKARGGHGFEPRVVHLGSFDCGSLPLFKNPSQRTLVRLKCLIGLIIV